MRPVEKVSQDAVWAHWQQTERLESLDCRSDILNKLPADLQWYRCEIEQSDLGNLYVISSRDWISLTNNTFRVIDAARNLEDNKQQQGRIVKDIREKIRFLESGGELDRNLITITDSPSLSGPFSIIEGNRRSVCFASRRMLLGSTIFVGYSPGVVDCSWARAPYRTFLENR